MKTATIAAAANAACAAVGVQPCWTDEEIADYVGMVIRGEQHSAVTAHAVLRPAGNLSANETIAVSIAIALIGALARGADPDTETETAPVELENAAPETEADPQ